MTTLQDRVEAFAKPAAAGALSTTSTVGSVTREPEREEVPGITIHEISSAVSPYLVSVQLVRGGWSNVEIREPSSTAWTIRQAEIPREGISLVDSPFDFLDERRKNQEKVRELISYIRSSVDVPFARKLATRLELLRRITQEEAPDQAEMSPASLRMFAKFLELAPDLKLPGVVLSPSGNVRVQWRAAPNKLFVAEFYPDGVVRLVIFRPDPKEPDQTIRLSGTASVASLRSTAEPHGVFDWAADERRPGP